MELGKKLKQARLELGLSQRQLCGDTITRNMLSLIENGAATPSMETLLFLAQQLGKPISYFLDEQTVSSPNQDIMAAARDAFSRGEYAAVTAHLKDYRSPDPVFDYEAALLRALSLLSMGEEAVARGKRPYARELLEQAAGAGEQTPYYTPELERRRLLALAQLIPTVLPVDDRELLLRAEEALRQEKPEEAGRYLDAAQDRTTAYWNYLRGKSFLEQGQYAAAKDCLTAAWEYAPASCAADLERCCRELEDYKGAYHYACTLREM